MALPVLCTYSRMLLQEHFDAPNDMALKPGDNVVISTRRGTEVGRVAAQPGTTELRRDEAVAGKVLRKAAPEDMALKREELVRFRSPQALKDARRLVSELRLAMKIEDMEETLDRGKYIFYFTAEGRVDFRELVRRMGNQLGRRIELRQIGARDVARLSGDVDTCGEELCCKSFLIDFIPVSMKMAKNQDMSLDKSKVSGICGRLKCCLKYEDDLYTELRKTVPLQGQPVKVDGKDGWVFAVNILNQMVTVDLNGTREDFPVSAITFDRMAEREVRAFQRERWAEIQRVRDERMARRDQKKVGGAPAAPVQERPEDRDEPRGENDDPAVGEENQRHADEGADDVRDDGPDGDGAENSEPSGDSPGSQGERQEGDRGPRRRNRGRRRGGGSRRGSDGGGWRPPEGGALAGGQAPQGN
ncbi:MAG: hypothetical protein L6Q71_04320 [Planctomycetes bacterium]|nr:hypothetical protein [Planctomycetota bacterium]NUQ34638.1 hypothetical protein [Planctomycetaceae bacterium]